MFKVYEYFHSLQLPDKIPRIFFLILTIIYNRFEYLQQNYEKKPKDFIKSNFFLNEI